MPFDLTEDTRTAAMISGSGRRHCVPGSSWLLGGDCGGEGGSGDGKGTGAEVLVRRRSNERSPP